MEKGSPLAPWGEWERSRRWTGHRAATGCFRAPAPALALDPLRQASPSASNQKPFPVEPSPREAAAGSTRVRGLLFPLPVCVLARRLLAEEPSAHGVGSRGPTGPWWVLWSTMPRSCRGSTATGVACRVPLLCPSPVGTPYLQRKHSRPYHRPLSNISCPAQLFLFGMLSLPCPVPWQISSISAQTEPPQCLLGSVYSSVLPTVLLAEPWAYRCAHSSPAAALCRQTGQVPSPSFRGDHRPGHPL